jgi:hypothetical protein
VKNPKPILLSTCSVVGLIGMSSQSIRLRLRAGTFPQTAASIHSEVFWDAGQVINFVRTHLSPSDVHRLRELSSAIEIVLSKKGASL